MIQLPHMTHIKKYLPYALVGIIALLSVSQYMQVSSLKGEIAAIKTSEEEKFGSLVGRVDQQEKALYEIAGVIKESGLIVPDAEGKAQINTMLRDAWMQVNGM